MAGRPDAPTIRPARPEDAAAVAAIWNPVIRETTITFRPDEWREADLRAWIEDHAREDRPVLVSEDGGRVAGFAAWGQLRPGLGYARTAEHTLMLAPRARGRGLGRALLEAVETRARAEGAHTMWAAVSAENAPAIAFHATCGYAEAARLAEVGLKFGRWIDLVLMVKRL